VLRYKVDLKAFMADCEANYYRLRQLVPRFDDLDRFQLGLPGSHRVIMTLDVIERTPYTSLVEISQQGAAGLTEWLPEPSLKVRLYHDARLAEVVHCAGRRNPRARYLYPNEEMLQPDEKAQWNRFLSEWLSLAIDHGFVADMPCEFVG
jgi:uncharacterized protein YqiB (DUF1249 family)